MSSKLTFGDLSSALALGSLSFLGVFFIVDHYIELWTLFGQFAGDATWAVVLSLPTLVITYTVGLFNIHIANLLFNKLFKRDRNYENELFISIALINNDAITQKYFELKRLQVFFQACFIAFLVLGIGTCFTYRWVPRPEVFSFLIGVGLIVIGCICPILSKIFYKQIIDLVKLIENKRPFKKE